jgi:hypothetical protein
MSYSTVRELQLLRISHEELLLLLGVARLPMPLALGNSALDGYTEASLSPALASAGGSLIARGLLIPPGPRGRSQPEIVVEVESLLADIALAESCLMVVAGAGDEARSMVYTARGDAVVRHTRPLERVHHLERLADAAAIVAQLQQLITAPAPSGEPLDFAAQADVLMMAVDAVAAGRSQNARSILLMGDVSPATVEAFLERAGNELAQHTLLLFHKIQTDSPAVDNLIVLRGHAEAWLVEKADETDEGARTRVRTLDEAALRARLQQLVDAMDRATVPLA